MPLDVDAASRLTVRIALGPGVGGALGILLLPVVADLFEAVLQRGEGRPVGPLL
jgi:hypothetical protein